MWRAVSRIARPYVSLAIFASVVWAQTLTFPALTGRVVDEANILDSATPTALTEKLAALEAKTTNQFVVVTLKSLQGQNECPLVWPH
jgi:uncharacterized protein